MSLYLNSKEYLDKPGNNFVQTDNKGQCTELTWAYMNQLWKGKQPTDDGSTTDGYRVHEVYKKKVLKLPTNQQLDMDFLLQLLMEVRTQHHQVIQVW